MSTLYPGGIDSFDTRVDGVTDVMAADVNDLQDAMVAVQTESQLRTLFRVKNASGATVVANDVGYIDEAGDFKTTTTASLDATWAVVVTGGANNSQVMVCTRGRLLVNYTGTAPSINHYLVTSTTAGSAQRQITMRPEIFAVCLANGAAGTVEVLLLTGSEERVFTDSNDTLRINTLSDTDFVATINGGVAADEVVYNAPTSGTEDTIDILTSAQVGKIVLHNTTRGDSALIDSVVVGTNTITLTANAPAAWDDTDDITARSQTVTGVLSGSAREFDLDLSGFLPELVRSAMFILGHDESAPAAANFAQMQEFNGSPSFSVGTIIQGVVAGLFSFILTPVNIFDKTVCFAVDASGVATSNIIIRIRSINVAVP